MLTPQCCSITANRFGEVNNHLSAILRGVFVITQIPVTISMCTLMQIALKANHGEKIKSQTVQLI